MLEARELFDVNRVPQELRELVSVGNPWEVLARLDQFLKGVRDARHGHVHPTAVIEGGPVYLSEAASVGPHAFIQGPAWIGPNAKVKHGAQLRGGVVLADEAEVGHSSEVKHALLLARARAPHFNYVGDAVIGCNVNLGAGVKLANVHTFGEPIKVGDSESGLRKFSAAIGDDVSIGCNAVLAPGTLVGARSVIYHGAMVRGVIPADTVVKFKPQLEQVRRY